MGNTYIVAPPDGRVPRAADPSTVARARSVGGPVARGQPVEVRNTFLDALLACGGEVTADHVALGQTARANGRVGRGRGEAEVRVDSDSLGDDLLDGAVEDLDLSGGDFDRPGEGLDAVLGERVV